MDLDGLKYIVNHFNENKTKKLNKVKEFTYE